MITSRYITRVDAPAPAVTPPARPAFLVLGVDLFTVDDMPAIQAFQAEVQAMTLLANVRGTPFTGHFWNARPH